TVLGPRLSAHPTRSARTKETPIPGDPDSAWIKALQDLQNRADTSDKIRTKAAETAQLIDRHLRLSPPVIDHGLIDLTTLQPALDWLASRLKTLTKSANDTAETNTSTTFITEAADHVTSFRAALAQLPAENLRVRELFDIADACAPTTPHTTAEALAAPWTRVP